MLSNLTQHYVKSSNTQKNCSKIQIFRVIKSESEKKENIYLLEVFIKICEFFDFFD